MGRRHVTVDASLLLPGHCRVAGDTSLAFYGQCHVSKCTSLSLLESAMSAPLHGFLPEKEKYNGNMPATSAGSCQYQNHTDVHVDICNFSALAPFQQLVSTDLQSLNEVYEKHVALFNFTNKNRYLPLNEKRKWVMDKLREMESIPGTDPDVSYHKRASKTREEDSLHIDGSLKREPEELERETYTSATGKRKQQSVGLASALPADMETDGSEHSKQSNNVQGEGRVLPNVKTTTIREDSSQRDKAAGLEEGEEDMDCSLTPGRGRKRDRAEENASQSSKEEGEKQSEKDDEGSNDEWKEDDEGSDDEWNEDDADMKEDDEDSLEYVHQYVRSLERARTVEFEVRLTHHKHRRNLRAVTTAANDICTKNRFELPETEREINGFYAAQFGLKTKVENDEIQVDLSSYAQHFEWSKSYEEKYAEKRVKKQRNTTGNSKTEEQTDQTTSDSESVDELNRQTTILEAQVNALRDQNRELDENCLNLKDIATGYNREIEAAARLDTRSNPKRRTIIPYRWNNKYETWEIAYHKSMALLTVIDQDCTQQHLKERISDAVLSRAHILGTKKEAREEWKDQEGSLMWADLRPMIL
ncbi:hypothetical protein CBR_g29339 [Chara braunii]|uniref:Uncharacterized protein n=1 Tax=Chara braunii TaxID=69332 RepID=A0A388JWH7_CHABU|nr:hypothetical protein CBR_g29339 [Chara braunii]|eukprot:GBG62140.1 hypothetical protein CBR_g29339 [Chara braunii]